MAKFNFSELFSIHLRKAQPDSKDYLNVISILFNPIMEQQNSKEEVNKRNI
jgi:hypothetical protein